MIVSGGACVGGTASVGRAFETTVDAIRSPKTAKKPRCLPLDCADAAWLIGTVAMPITNRLVAIRLERRRATGLPGNMERSLRVRSLCAALHTAAGDADPGYGLVLSYIVSILE
jgi:hypothetical protein